MRILFLTGSPVHYMAPPQLGAAQIVAGPDWPDEQSPKGDWISIKTPVGDYNLVTLLDKLAADQQPDAVVSLVDASWRNTPRNLTAFRGPKVLLVADTHHLSSPLIGMLRYAASEHYDRIVFLYDRHHLSFFHSAGFNNLYWFPGLTFPHNDETVKAARKKMRNPRIAFVGQSGKFHPHRARLLDAVKTSNLPLDERRLSQRQALDFYGSSAIGFNASLNGDLNLRVFEILASGAGLLTDQLAPESGLSELFPRAHELATYASADELVERARHYLTHPEEGLTLGAAGAHWFDKFLNADARAEMFRGIAVDGITPTLFEFTPTCATRIFFGGDTDRLVQTAIVYEQVQELHRVKEGVEVGLSPAVPEGVSALLATLPRVRCGALDASAAADLLVCSHTEIAAGVVRPTQLLWCWDAPLAGDATIEAHATQRGFESVSADVALFRRKPSPAPAIVLTPRRVLPVRRKIYITFGGEVYDGTTALQVLLAPKFGADEVRVYDDHWLMHEHKEFVAQNRWLWEHHHQRGFGWYAWKPFLLINALNRAEEGDVVLFTDADTFPIQDFSVLFETCARDGGIMLFKAGGHVSQRFTQGQWCKRDCFAVMNQDEERYRTAEAGVARFMLFQKGPWRAQQFLMEWLTYCVNQRATTFDPSVLGTEPKEFVEHRTEQAIMTNLAHKYDVRLYREACELGHTFPEDKDLYPQLFSQLNPWGNKTAPCVGSRFRNVSVS